MRQRFSSQPELHVLPIERVQLPLHSRDELPPILAGLQWLWSTPLLKAEIFAILEAQVLHGKRATGRTGMDLWHILVFGVVRLGLSADWDRLEYLANYDQLLRQILGVASEPWGAHARLFNHQTLRDNVALLDEVVLKEINARIAAASRQVFAPTGGPLPPLELKTDSYVLETDVHFPTDLNLLFDCGRKSLDLIEKFQDRYGYEFDGWRKLKDWRRRFKAAERVASQTKRSGGKDQEKRLLAAVSEYLAVARPLSQKIAASLLSLCSEETELHHWDQLAYFQVGLDKQIDLVERRLLQGQTIPAVEKTHSYFEPHTEWISKGKLHPNVELGHRVLATFDQNQILQDYDTPSGVDVAQSVPVVDRLLGRYGPGAIASVSFDKGFTCAGDRELLELFIPMVVMPKRGKKNSVEMAAEGTKQFVALRHAHSAVESGVNALEHHGLNRCLDVGLEGFQRYVGYGVLAYNLHRIGREIQACQRRAEAEQVRLE